MGGKKVRPNLLESRAIARRWWESFPKDARPTGNFVGLARMLERNLDAGWDADRLDRVMLAKIRSPRVPTAQRIADAYMAQTNNDVARRSVTPIKQREWWELEPDALAKRWTLIPIAQAHAEIVRWVRKGGELPWEEFDTPYFARVARREAVAQGPRE